MALGLGCTADRSPTEASSYWLPSHRGSAARPGRSGASTAPTTEAYFLSSGGSGGHSEPLGLAQLFQRPPWIRRPRPRSTPPNSDLSDLHRAMSRNLQILKDLDHAAALSPPTNPTTKLRHFRTIPAIRNSPNHAILCRERILCPSQVRLTQGVIRTPVSAASRCRRSCTFDPDRSRRF